MQNGNLDFDNTCRLCLASSNSCSLEPIFGEEDTRNNILLFAEIDINQDDDLPQKLCQRCLDNLRVCLHFKYTSEKSHRILLNIFTESKKNIKIEIDTDNKIDIDYSSDYEDNLPLSETFTKQNPVKYECNTCNYTTSNEKHLIRHIEKEHTKLSFKRNKCETCNKSYLTTNSLLIHKKSHILPNGELKKKTPIPCEHCSEVFEMKKKLISHIKDSHRKDIRKRHCDICNKTLANKFSFITHMRHHRGERPYVCETCGQKFSQPGSLKTHKLIHEGVLPFQCPECPYRARLKRSLNMHMVVHTGERAFTCHLCPKSYTSGTNLHKHIRTHDPSTRFKCDHCDKAFTVRTNMLDHVAAVHLGTKRHRCDICDERFSSNSTLNRHRHDVHKIKKHPGIRKGKLPDYLKLQNSDYDDLKGTSYNNC